MVSRRVPFSHRCCLTSIISDLPETTSRKYGYADDLAILLRHPSWTEMEEGLNKNMAILVDYLRKWRLQLSIGKTVSAAYHPNNKEAKRELDVFVDDKRLVCQQAPRYLGVRLDRMMNFKQHLEEVAGKVTPGVALIRRLAGTTWGASAKTLRISTQALVFPAAEYCAPVWSRSPHVKKGDVAINSSLRTISGCLKPTPVLQLPVLAGIAPAGLRRKAATLALARKAVKHDWHIRHNTTENEVPPCRLKSRKPYNKEAQELDAECHPRGLAEGSLACRNVEPGVGSIGTHPSTSPRIGPRTRRQGRRTESKALDDSKQTENWGRSMQSFP